MDYDGLPESIAARYYPQEVIKAKIDDHHGSPRIQVTLRGGRVDCWRDSIKKGWYKVQHKEYVDLEIKCGACGEITVYHKTSSEVDQTTSASCGHCGRSGHFV